MEQKRSCNEWCFTGVNGDFTMQQPHKSSYLYFPLANEAGMMSVVTPLLHGDIKLSQNAFLMTPVSAEDLHNSRSARNFWVFIEGVGAWSVVGNSAPQVAQNFILDNNESVRLEAGFLWHKLIRENKEMGIISEVTNFVPTNDDKVELMKVKIKNIGEKDIKITPTAAIPIYGRYRSIYKYRQGSK